MSKTIRTLCNGLRNWKGLENMRTGIVLGWDEALGGVYVLGLVFFLCGAFLGMPVDIHFMWSAGGRLL